MKTILKLFSSSPQKIRGGYSRGFALPALVITATILMISAVSVAQTTVSIATSLSSRSYSNLADEAVQAGVSYAYSCLKKNGTSYWSNPLKPNTTCTGASSSGSTYIKDQAASGNNPHWRSTFSVSVPNSNSQSVSEGKVELLDASSNVTNTFVSSKVVVINATGSSGGVTQISTGGNQSCALTSSKLYCWGQNSNGQLGNNSTTQSNVPVAVNTSGVLSGKTVSNIAPGGGRQHDCVIANGSAYCWGGNGQGQLGNNSTTQSNVPVAVNTSGVLSGKIVTGLTAAAYYHSCALANGSAYCWGNNANGQLGNNSTTQSNVPVAVNTSGVLSGKIVTAISGGAYHSCAVADGKAYCWGYNSSGLLGNNSTTQSLIPVAVYTGGVLSGKAVTGISVSTFVSCAVADGKAYCWGQNAFGWLGSGTSSGSTVPLAVYTGGVMSGKTVTAISVGDSHACAIANGSAYCWGGNGQGQLGNNSTTDSNVPVAVNTSGVLNGKTVESISAGIYHTCAVADGQAYCWGNNANGQLGNGTTTNSSVPVAVSPFGG